MSACLVGVVGLQDESVDVCELVCLGRHSGLEVQVTALLVGEDGMDLLGGVPANVRSEHDAVRGVSAKVWHLVLAALPVRIVQDRVQFADQNCPSSKLQETTSAQCRHQP